MTESGSSSVASTSTQPATPQFIQSSIPLPSKLDFKGNLAVNWKKFKRLWTNYEIASRLSTQSSNLRTATLLTCIGPDILEIYDGLPFGNEEEKTDIDKVIELLDAFFIGETNEIHEAYLFNQRVQEIPVRCKLPAIMAEGSSKALDDVTPPAEEKEEEEEEVTLDFDDDTLTAIVEVYKNEGNEVCLKGDFLNASHFYTEGIKVKCGNKELKAKLYNNRATVHFKLGNYQESLRDATAAYQLEPTYLKAIIRGASACLELNKPEEALRWSVQGLVIERNDTLRLLRGRSFHECFKSGNMKKAIEIIKQDLHNAKELGDSADEGRAYYNLGSAYHKIGNFSQAIKYHKQHLSIAKELEDRSDEECAFHLLGQAYHDLGDFNHAIKNANKCLSIARKPLIRSKALKVAGKSYMSMGKLYRAMQFFQDYLDIAKRIGDREGEAEAYVLIGTVNARRDDFNQATEYLEKALTMAKELRDQEIEAMVYASFGEVLRKQGDFERAIEYNKKCLNMVQKSGQRIIVGNYLANLGRTYESSGDLHQAVDYYQRSTKLFNELRVLQVDDALKVIFRNARQDIYQSLCRTLLKLSKFDEALCAADQGRAQALLDLIKLRYGCQLAVSGSVQAKPGISEMVTNISGPTLFVALQGNAVNLWVIGKNRNVQFTKKEVKYLLGDATDYLSCLRKKAYEEIRGRFRVICENRTLDGSSTEQELPPAEERGEETGNPLQSDENPLRLFHECIISPISDLIEDGELVVVPDGPLCLAPFAAFLDSESRYLSESTRIRILPSLMCMKLINASPKEYHNKSGALLVGDPCLDDFTTLLGENRYPPLPCAKKEVEMIGAMLGIHPLTGKEATKAEVLKRIGSVALVHIAAYGKIDTGEIALAPNPERKYRRPEEQDFRLTISDVQAAKLRAKLVVLSCCHSAQGEVSSEGVVGIARAFLGAGARSVLVALWSIDDEATMEFMRSFYQHLKDGNSASVSLNRAMKCLRESEDFNAPRFWAPFVLIGDDVTIDLKEINNESSQEEQVSLAEVKDQEELE